MKRAASGPTDKNGLSKHWAGCTTLRSPRQINLQFRGFMAEFSTHKSAVSLIYGGGCVRVKEFIHYNSVQTICLPYKPCTARCWVGKPDVVGSRRHTMLYSNVFERIEAEFRLIIGSPV